MFGVSALWAAADACATADSEPWALTALDMFSGATTCTLDARNPACPAFFAAVVACSSLLRRAQGCDLATLLPATQQLARTAAKPTLKDKEAIAIIKAVHSALHDADAEAAQGKAVAVAAAKPWSCLTAAEATAALTRALGQAKQANSKGFLWEQVMTGVALSVRLLCAHSSPRTAAELAQGALAGGREPMQSLLEEAESDGEDDAARLRPPVAAFAVDGGGVAGTHPPRAAAAAAAAASNTAARPQRGRTAPALGVTLANDVSDSELIDEYGVPVPLHQLPEASTLSKLLTDPAQAAAEVQVANPGSSYSAHKERNVCVGILEAFAERVRSLCTAAVATGAQQQAAAAHLGRNREQLSLVNPAAAEQAEGWFDAPIPDILDGSCSWAFLRDLQHFIVAPFGTGIRPSAVNAVVALLGSPTSLPRAWVVDVTRAIITAAADTDTGLTAATYDTLTTLCMWRLPLADVISLILDSMRGTATPLAGPPLPAVMPVGSSHAGLVGATPPSLSDMSSVAPPRLQRTLLWLAQAMRHARVPGDGRDAAAEKSATALLSNLRSRDTSRMTLQPVCMGPHAWLHLGQALGVALQHRNEQVRDAAAVALGEALSLVGDSPALAHMMQDVDLLKAARMVAAWTKGAPGEQGRKPPRRGRSSARRGAAGGGGTRMRRSERLLPAPSPPSLSLSVPPMALVGSVPTFPPPGAAGEGGQAAVEEVTELRIEPLLEQSTALWTRLGLHLPRAPFTLAFTPTLRHLSERRLAQALIQQEAEAVKLGDQEAESAVAEVVAAAGNLLYTAVELRSYKLQLVCLMLLRRHARIVARIQMVQALPLELHKLLGRYNIPNKAAAMSFASHRHAIRAAVTADLTPAGFLGSLNSLWGMKEMQAQLAKYFRQHYRDILNAIEDPLPSLDVDEAGACSVVAAAPSEASPADVPAAPKASRVLVISADVARAGHFSCLNVPSQFLVAALGVTAEEDEGIPHADAFLLFAHWLRDAIKTVNASESSGAAASGLLAFPPGVLDADVRAIAWDCLHPECLPAAQLAALAHAQPVAFGLLNAVKVMQGVQQG